MILPKKVNLIFYFLFGLMFCSKNLWALTSDKFQIIEVSAKSADINQETHQGIYIGDVTFDQGSTHIRAYKAITKTDKENKLKIAIALGDSHKQAHYWTLTALDKPPLHAYADKILFYPNEHKIELIGNSKIEQGKNSFTAPKIVYNIKTKHVFTPEANQQTFIIINPNERIKSE